MTTPRRSWVRDPYAVALAILAAWLLPELVWPRAWVYRELFPDAVMFPLSSVLKLVLQLLAATGAWACARRFDPDDRTRRAWRWLGHGMATMAAGQLVLARWHVGAASAAPFPSPADACFVAATLILAAALADFALAHVEGGFDVGSRAQARRTAAVVVVVSLGVLAPPLSVVLQTADPLGQRLLAGLYPLLDVALLAPAVVVLRQIGHLRGGGLWRGWLAIVLGVIALAIGDLAFAFVSGFGLTQLDPLLDLTFASGYLLVAWGARLHLRVIGA
jgi:hypothetical protein